MSNIQRMRELLSKATPGPHTNDGVMVFSLHVPNGRSACVAPLICSTDVSHRRYADAELIVAALNALPALLEVVEAAQHAMHCRNGHGPGNIGLAYDRLEDALAKLDEVKS